MEGLSLFGGICGDVIGSVYEFNDIKTTNFDLVHKDCTFTDDTVLTCAVAVAILNPKQHSFSNRIIEYAKKYPYREYGSRFESWIYGGDYKPYNSYGNGSAMRVSSIGLILNGIDMVLRYAKESAEVTHNHPEGIKGAQAVASAIYYAKIGESKEFIKKYIEDNFGYNLNQKLDDIRLTYQFNDTCQGSVPQAIIAFMESYDYESAIRLAISIGGDSDTIACITGSIAGAYYKYIPDNIIKFVSSKLDEHLLSIICLTDYHTQMLLDYVNGVDSKEDDIDDFVKVKYNNLVKVLWIE